MNHEVKCERGVSVLVYSASITRGRVELAVIDGGIPRVVISITPIQADAIASALQVESVKVVRVVDGVGFEPCPCGYRDQYVDCLCSVINRQMAASPRRALRG